MEYIIKNLVTNKYLDFYGCEHFETFDIEEVNNKVSKDEAKKYITENELDGIYEFIEVFIN